MSPIPSDEPRSERNPEATRQRILLAAFEEIHRKGYQGMRVDDVLRATGLTKGGLYHHFSNKKALGYAVVEQVIAGMIDRFWLEPLRDAEDPLAAIQGILRHLLEAELAQEMIELGCPLNNLAQEMSPLDEGFRRRLDRVFQQWHQGLVDALEAGKRAGKVRSDIDSQRTATFVQGAIEGCIGMAKNAQTKERFATCSAGLGDYLQSLRP
jgi:AcrR family transcriptional regulator